MTQVHGIEVHGQEANELLLSDGSRLLFDSEGNARGPGWLRVKRDGRERVSVREAEKLAGDEFAPFVHVRTRFEAEWLGMLSSWANERSIRLSTDLGAI